MSELVYLACPFTHPNSTVRQARFEAVTRIAARLMEGGQLHVYSPITHSYPMKGLPIDYEFWRDHARAMIERSTRLWVLCLWGWRESIGVQDEIGVAEELGKPVVYLVELVGRLLFLPTQEAAIVYGEKDFRDGEID